MSQKSFSDASLIPLFGVKLTRLNEEEREKMVEKLEEAIKALERLANRVSEKKQGIESPH